MGSLPARACSSARLATKPLRPCSESAATGRVLVADETRRSADLRTVDISPDYSAFKVDHGGSYVGYGLELEGKHGNLPWIGRM